LSFGQDDKGFAFKDNGIGVDPEQTARAFHPFERLNGDAFPGLGMGLTYAKRIVAMHDGTISLDGEPGEGAVVRFTLGI
jgi:signal transduction histidine kinase